MLYLVGCEVVYPRNRFVGVVREMETACQQIVAQKKKRQAPGALLLGAESGRQVMLLL